MFHFKRAFIRVLMVGLVISLAMSSVASAKWVPEPSRTMTQAEDIPYTWQYTGHYGVDGQPYPEELQEGYLNGPEELLLDHATGRMYVVESGGDRLSAIEGTPPQRVAGFPIWQQDGHILLWALSRVSLAGEMYWLGDINALYLFNTAGDLLQTFPHDGGGCVESIAVDVEVTPWRVYIGRGCGPEGVDIYDYTGSPPQAVLSLVDHFNPPQGVGPNFKLADLDGDPSDRELYMVTYRTSGEDDFVWMCKNTAAWNCTRIGEGLLSHPHDIAIRPGDANFYVLENNFGGQIYQCTTAGVCSLLVNGSAIPEYQIYEARNLEVDADLNVYLSLPRRHVILKIPAAGGYTTAQVYYGTPDVPYVTAPGYFSQPAGIAVDGDYNLYVTDQNRLTKMAPNGDVLWTFGTPGVNVGDPAQVMPNLTQLALDSSGNIYIQDNDRQRVMILLPDGSYGTSIYAGDFPAGESFSFQTGIAVGPGGQLYIGDNFRVQVYKHNVALGWQYQSTIGIVGGFAGISALAVRSEQEVYVADNEARVVYRCVRASSTATQWNCAIFVGILNDDGSPGSISRPVGLALDAGGHLFVVSTDGRVRVVNGNGEIIQQIQRPRMYGWQLMGTQQGAALGSGGQLFVANPFDQRVEIYNRMLAASSEFIWQGGGASLAIEEANGYLYMADGPRLRVYTLDNPLNPVSVIKTGLLGNIINDIAISNGYLYSVAWDGTLAVLDLSDPSSPNTVWMNNVGGGMSELSASGGRLYIGFNSGSLDLYSLADPAAPVWVATANTGSSLLDVLAVGNFVYTANGQDGVVRKLKAADLSEVDSFTVSGGNFSGLAWAGGNLLAADLSNGLYKINPLDMTMSDFVAIDPPPQAVIVEGDYAYLNTSPGNYPDPYAIVVVRISNFSEVGRYSQPGGSNMDAAVHNGVLYVPNRWLYLNTYAIDYGNPDALTITLADTDPRVFTWVQLAQAAENTLYVSQVSSTLAIFDTHIGGWPSMLGSWQHPVDAWPVDLRILTVNGRKLVYLLFGPYCITETNCPAGEVLVLDATQASLPTVKGSFILEHSPAYFDVRESGGQVLAYLAESGFWDAPGTTWTPGRVEVLNLTDPQAITRLGVLEGVFDGMITYAVLADDLFFVSEWICTPDYGCNGGGGLTAVEVSDPQNMSVAYYDGGRSYYQTARLGQRLYAGSSDNLYLLDFSAANPANWTRTALLPGPEENVNAVAASQVNGHIYAWAVGNRLYWLDVTDPLQPRMLEETDSQIWTGPLVKDGPLTWTWTQWGGLGDYWQAPLLEAQIPAAGGSAQSEIDEVTYSFGAGTFNGSTRLIHVPLYPGRLPAPPEGLMGVMRAFDVLAVDAISDAPVVPALAYTVEISYDGWYGKILDETTLALYAWDGSQWVKELSSTVDVQANVVTAHPTHFSRWQVLGKPIFRAYLPVLTR